MKSAIFTSMQVMTCLAVLLIGLLMVGQSFAQENALKDRASARLRFGRTGSSTQGAPGLSFVAASSKGLRPPKLPWAVPAATVGNGPVDIAVDTAKHTIYVANEGDNTLSVIDSSKCNSANASSCAPIATITVGPGPLYVVLDPTTDTLYVTLPGPNFDQNTVAVVNGATCNATNTSGCGQTPALVTLPSTPIGLALDTPTHTLYVGFVDESPVSIINTATCNATNASGCGQIPVLTSAGGDTLTIDSVNHGIYVSDFADSLIRVFNGATCNAGNTSGCGQAPATLAVNFNPSQAGVDEATHTVFVPVQSCTLNSVLMIQGSTCNGTDNSGCGNTPNRANIGSGSGQALIDPATETVYVLSQGSSSLSAINGATCNATNTSGCATIPPALAVGNFPGFVSLDSNTHTLYMSSQDTNTVWVLDASKCNATHTSGCTKFEPTTNVGCGATGMAVNPNTQTLYEANQGDNTVSVIDTTACNKDHHGGCKQSWPTFAVGANSRFIGINKLTNTLYVVNTMDNTLSLINGATCNRQMTSGCTQLAITSVGNTPQEIEVDEKTNTIYVVNQGDGTVSVANGAVCNAGNTSGCNQSWPLVTVGQSPQALALNPTNYTLYVANTNDNTASVINVVHCNGSDSSGCGQTPATIPVGAAPRAVGIVTATNTVFVGNRDDLTVSVIDGSTCNGTKTSGCGQVPPTVLIGAFPGTGGNFGNNILGRSIAVDSRKHMIYIPTVGDSDVATLDANDCRAGHVQDCHVHIVHKRMGGFSVVATVDESSETVYVSNDDDNTLSLFSDRDGEIEATNAPHASQAASGSVHARTPNADGSVSSGPNPR